MGDFDLLIHRSSARAAITILNASGWTGAVEAAFSDADFNRYHAIGLWDSSGTCVDLHWRPTASIATPRHAEGVRERSVAASLEGRPVSVASATDHLFILLCHAFEDDIERRNDWIAEVDLLFRLVRPRSGIGRSFNGSRASTSSIAGFEGRSRHRRRSPGDRRRRAPSGFWGLRRRGEARCRIARSPGVGSRRPRGSTARRARTAARRAVLPAMRSVPLSSPSAPSRSPSRASL